MKKAKYFNNKSKVKKCNLIFKNLYNEFILTKNEKKDIKYLYDFMDIQLNDIKINKDYLKE